MAHWGWEYHDDHNTKPDSGFLYAGLHYLWSSCVPAVLGAASAPPSQPLLLVFSSRVGPILTTIVLAAFSKGRSVLKRLPELTICHLGRIEVARRSQLGNTDDGEKTAA